MKLSVKGHLIYKEIHETRILTINIPKWVNRLAIYFNIIIAYVICGIGVDKKVIFLRFRHVVDPHRDVRQDFAKGTDVEHSCD